MLKIIVIDTKNYNKICDKFCDILVMLSDVHCDNLEIFSKIAILNGDNDFASYKNIKYDTLITYGMNRKNSATISSSDEKEILISTLREFNNILGNNIEITEFFFKKNQNSDLDACALGILHLILQK